MSPSTQVGLQINLPPEPASVARARRAARDLATQGGAPSDDVALAVSEVVTNAIAHAGEGHQGPVSLRVALEEDCLLVVVEDHAGGMRPNPESPGMGIGLSVVKRVVRALRIEHLGHGTRVIMEFPRA